MRTVRRWIWNALAVFGAASLVVRFGFLPARATSNSMEPRLHGVSWDEGDHILIERFSYRWRQPRRWEVIAYRFDTGQIYLKRVLALPGETLQLYKDGRMLIDGKPVEKPAYLADVRYFPVGNILDGKPFHCDGGYYVMGDDSYDSDDSRFNGVAAQERLIGRAWLILRPWSRFGRINER